MIVWEDPPRRKGGRANQGKWIPILTPVMERPNEWARVQDFPTPLMASSAAGALRKPNGAKGATLTPSGRWTFASCAVPEGGALYARYLGPDLAPTEYDPTPVSDPWKAQA